MGRTVHWHDFAQFDELGTFADRRVARRVQRPLVQTPIRHWHEYVTIEQARPKAPDVSIRDFRMGTLRAWVKLHSVKQGEPLVTFAAADGMTSADLYWRICLVESIKPRLGDFDPRPKSLTGTDPTVLDAGGPVKGKASKFRYDRERTGYGFDRVALRGPTDYLVPETWSPGLYAIQFAFSQIGFDDANVATAFFVLRPKKPKAQVLLCWPFATSAAYAGLSASYESFYDWGDSKRVRRVSLDRPLHDTPTSFGDKWIHTLRAPLTVWNYIRSALPNIEVEPCTSFDLERDSSILWRPIPGTGSSTAHNYQLFLSVGHDEYWSKRMRDAVERFVEREGNVAFFSGNTAWAQVRFEDDGHTMVCYKNTIEEPASVAAKSDVASLWSANPTNRPENTLTGVSGRRAGFGGTSAPYVVRKSDVLLGSLQPLDTIPSSGASLGLEIDGCDFDPNSLLPTGLDGTPLGFNVLATGDARSNPQWPGVATLGYFTNHGTVFTAGMTDWAKFLMMSDSAMETVTSAVITNLSKLRVGPSMSLRARSFPPMQGKETFGSKISNQVVSYPWQFLESTQAKAIAASIQGRLFRIRLDDGIDARDLENPTLGTWTSTGLSAPVDDAPVTWRNPFVPRVATCSLHGGNILCSTRVNSMNNGPLLPMVMAHHLHNVGWQQVRALVGSVLQLAVTDRPQHAFICAVEQKTDRWLFDDLGNKVGRWLHETMTASGFEGRLFATKGGHLYSRDCANNQSAIDLAWRRIGRAPPTTFAMAAALGRIYALAGRPDKAELYWRTALSDPPWRDPSVLFIAQATPKDAEVDEPFPVSKMTIGDSGDSGGISLAYVRDPPVTSVSASTGLLGTIEQNGDFTTTLEPINLPTFDLVCRANDTDVFFYRYDGSATLVRFAGVKGPVTRSMTWAPGSFGAWTSITYVNDGRVLFYEKGNGTAIIGTFAEDGKFEPLWSDPIGPGWTHLCSSNDGVDGAYVVLYNDSGAYGIGHVQPDGKYKRTVPYRSGIAAGWTQMVAAGQTYILLYDRDTGEFALTEYVHGDLRTNWTLVTSETLGVLCGAENGILLRKHGARSVTTGIRADDALLIEMRNLQDALGSGWTHVVGLGGLS